MIAALCNPDTWNSGLVISWHGFGPSDGAGVEHRGARAR
jgi:hypothetical protein